MSDESLDLEYKPKLRIHFEDVTHKAVNSFVTLVDCSRVLPNAIKQILRILYNPHGHDNIPKVRSVTLYLKPTDGVAWTNGTELDDMHKEITLNLNHIQWSMEDPVRFRDESIGVITHEMVHCYQHGGNAPGGLIEGMADYVRLRCGLAPPHWHKCKDELGEKWDEGYQKTAWFLEWLEAKYGAGTVSRMNETLGREDYKEEEFWQNLFGDSVDRLFRRYVDTWDDESETHRKSSVVIQDSEDKHSEHNDEEHHSDEHHSGDEH